MDLHEETRGDVVLLTLDGDLLTGLDLAPLHERIKELTSAGTQRVVVDCVRAKWFGSAMLGILAASLMSLRAVHGDLKLVNVSESLKEALIVCRLDEVFDILPAADDAVASFTDDSNPP